VVLDRDAAESNGSRARSPDLRADLSADLPALALAAILRFFTLGAGTT